MLKRSTLFTGFVLQAGAMLAVPQSAAAQPPVPQKSQEAQQPATANALLLEAAQLDIVYGGKATVGGKVDSKLSVPVRGALNSWAAMASRLELSVVVPQKAHALVLGRAPQPVLVQAARWADEAWSLFDALPAPAGSGAGKAEAGATAAAGAAGPALVMALFDDEGFASPAWAGLLDELVERRATTRMHAEQMKDSPGAFMLRDAAFFAQHTFDMVGDKAAGDDEYRLGNEIANKTAQLLVESRFGRQPEVLRWGAGYVAEQELFGASYQFGSSGFIAATDHFDWPARTIDALKERAKGETFSLADLALRSGGEGTAGLGQRTAWAVLDYQLARDPKGLAALLSRLGELHRSADPRGASLEYRGDSKEARAALQASWGEVKTQALLNHLGRK